jgi:hypothetical protein
MQAMRQLASRLLGFEGTVTLLVELLPSLVELLDIPPQGLMLAQQPRYQGAGAHQLAAHSNQANPEPKCGMAPTEKAACQPGVVMSASSSVSVMKASMR